MVIMRVFVSCLFSLIFISVVAQPVKDSTVTKSKKLQSKPPSQVDEIAPARYEQEEKTMRKKEGVKSEATSDVEVLSRGGQSNAQSTATVSSNFISVHQHSNYQKSQRTPSVSQQNKMNEAVQFFELNAPKSFEYHYFKYLSSNYNLDFLHHLKEAERMQPDNTDVHVQLAACYMIQNDTKNSLGYIDRLIETGRLSSSALRYAEDILLSMPNNGTVITHGFDDMYAVWYQQKNNGVRPDVTIISLDFLQSAQYRKRLGSDYNIPESAIVDVPFLEEFCRSNPEKRIGISLTTPKDYFHPLLRQLYIRGLVFEYSLVPFDNFEANAYLWKHVLKKELAYQSTDTLGKQLSANYLPMLFVLRKVYRQLGDMQNSEKMDREIDRIASQSNKSKEVQKIKPNY